MTKKFNKEEAAELLRRINEGATQSDSSLGEVLRLCMRLGSILGNSSLTTWARTEATGYDTTVNLPDYRIVQTQSKGTFIGAFGSGVENMLIPSLIVDEAHRDHLFSYHVTESVTEIERLASGKNSMKVFWPADIIYYYQQKELFEERDDVKIAEAWRVLTPHSMTGILEIIRTRILDFVLKIERELGVTAKSAATQEPDPKTIQQLFQTIINGNGPVAFGNTGTVEQQVVNVQAGDLNSLRAYLKSLGVHTEDIEELSSILNKDIRNNEQPKEAIQTWLGRIIIKLSTHGTASVSSNVVGSLIAEAIIKYLGLT